MRKSQEELPFWNAAGAEKTTLTFWAKVAAIVLTGARHQKMGADFGAPVLWGAYLAKLQAQKEVPVPLCYKGIVFNQAYKGHPS